MTRMKPGLAFVCTPVLLRRITYMPSRELPASARLAAAIGHRVGMPGQRSRMQEFAKGGRLTRAMWLAFVTL